MQRQRRPGSFDASDPNLEAMRSARSALAALAISAAFLAALAPPAGAASDVAVDAGGNALDLHAGAGMPASNARVKSILEAHPNDFVTICVAGCDGKPKAVQILPRPVAGRAGGYVPTAAPIGKTPYGPPRPGKPVRQMADESSDVVCLAGCMGKPGSILQRINDLPPKAHPGADKGAKVPAAKP